MWIYARIQFYHKTTIGIDRRHPYDVTSYGVVEGGRLDLIVMLKNSSPTAGA
jgi:hypothetical protein